MERNLSVSIIIDNYNYDRYIGEAIDSALNQDYPNREIIVVDDGSTDNSKNIINSYGDKIISVFKDNGGQASAFNAGFKKSNGDVIFFLDSDDVLFPGAVANAIDLFSSEDITKVQWPLFVVDENGRRTGGTRPSQVPSQGNLKDVVLENGPTSCISSPTSGNAWAHHFLEKIFPIPEDVPYYKTCADEYMYTLAPVFGVVKTINKPQGFYRIHGKNIYSALSFERKLELELEGHGQQTAALSSALKKHGFFIDEELWRRNSWFHLLKAAIDDINTHIPSDDLFILVDDESWNVNEIFPERKILPFLECDGLYNGMPETDAVAINELDRLINSGAKYIVFAKQSFWWFRRYSKFFNYLSTNFSPVLQNDRILIYDLKAEL
jgi:glycosyltransferase involved in cell wall biosynthesis